MSKSTQAHTFTTDVNKGKQQIRQCFDTWTHAWNEGDISSYVDAYSDSSQTRYVNGSNNVILRGKQSIIDYFMKSSSMGGDNSGGNSYSNSILSLISLEIEVMPGLKDALCFGQYELSVSQDNKVDENKNENDTISGGENSTHSTNSYHRGCFTVHVRKDENFVWKIMSDHSS